jgi:diguanylate cyclase (GGDEF)-like protein
MPRQRTLPSPPAAHPAQESQVTAELIGTNVAAKLEATRPLTTSVMRQVLASALGVEESALASVDRRSLVLALDRLRRIAGTIERLSETAATDELTGILRRGPGMVALQRELDRERRRPTRGLIIAFLDVDGLKRANDTRGHAAGDELLRRVVASIRSRIRSYDLVFRYGGDEFVIALLDVDYAQAKRIVGDIRYEVTKRTGGMTVSVGATPFDEDDSAESAIARADSVLYLERNAFRPRRQARQAG